MPHEFEVDVTNPAHGRVVVGGVDVSNLVSRVSLDAPAGRISTLYLEVPAGGKLAGVGDVVVQQAGPEAIREWLATVSPDQLETEALAAEAEQMGSMSPGAKFRAGLLRILDGQHG